MFGWLFYDGGGGASPSTELVALHEGMQVCATLAWLIACGNLLQKLRKERSASGISYQSLCALIVSQFLNFSILLLILMGTNSDEGGGGGGGVSLIFVICQGVVLCLVSATFLVANRNFVHSYEDTLDTFGDISSTFKTSRHKAVLDTTSTNTTITGGTAGHTAVISSPTSNNGEYPSASTMSSRKRRILKVMSSNSCFKFINADRIASSLSVYQWHWLSLYILAAILTIPAEIIRAHRSSLPPLLSALESFADVLTAIALLPQLHMFHHSNHRLITPSMGKFIIALLAAKFASFTYWMTDPLFHRSAVLPGRGVKMATDLLNIAILSDFGYFFAKAHWSGAKHVLLPM